MLSVDHFETDPMIRSVNRHLNKIFSKTLRFTLYLLISRSCMRDLSVENFLLKRIGTYTSTQKVWSMHAGLFVTFKQK